MMLLVCAILGLWGLVGAEVSQISCCDCTTMFPLNVPQNVDPQSMRYPFRIQVNAAEYDTALDVNVNLTSLDPSRYFKMFMIQARRIADNVNRIEPIGGFKAVHSNVKVHPACDFGHYGTALVSSDSTPKNHVVLVWTAPNSFEGHVEFKATFIEDDQTFWVRERSEVLRDPKAEPLPSVVPPAVMPPIDPVITSDCGISKGCYRYPTDCIPSQCEYIATWREDANGNFEFELGGYVGFSDRYVALGLSEDIRMGNDVVMECVHNAKEGSVEVYQSYNHGKSNRRMQPNPKQDILSEEGSYNNGRLLCRFTRANFVNDVNGDYPLNRNAWHFLLARGTAQKGNIYRHGLEVEALPISSPYKVNLQTYTDFGDKARYPLVKAHACLMILAWIFCATIGLLLTKYYKPMWPNRRFLGERYWFVGHFNFMAWMVFFVIIGFILIFVEAGGYSQAPDLPGRAHPILGIIIFCCVLINPIIALIRPSEDNKCRPVFNWFHCIFGTIANVLAIPNIFIGMDFGKANIPWWSTWILVIYIIFHIIVEITLEVHQCFTHKKNKERRKKYEIQKRENPKAHVLEPEPVGRRFKSTMLLVHFVVTCVVTLIMIIIIAVS